jgi:hypothetical protein
VLDDVERRRFLVEPAREDALELAARVANVDLDEGAGKLLDLPGRGGFASAQPHDHVFGPGCLSRPKRELPHLAVALVEQPQHRDALRHRRGPRRDTSDGLRHVHRLDHLIVGRRVALRSTGRAAAADSDQRGKQHGLSIRAMHDQSGVHA